ncbi:iron chelate uptake ABC transporter family permease subunit [Providencia rettgeri]|nr:iron chelate uptake ABC transporter family permease subunit [Providencia rettgeri]
MGNCRQVFNGILNGLRLLAATFAGLALSIAGVLQRIIYNPLASPDILGFLQGLQRHSFYLAYY